MKECITKYTSAVQEIKFERFDSDYHYLEIIDSWTKNELELVGYSKNNFQDLLKDFVFVLKDLAEKTFELFSAAFRVKEGNKGAKNTFNNRLKDIKSSLEEIEKFTLVIEVNLQKQQLSEAKFIQAGLLILIDKFYSLLFTMGIKFIDSPISRELKKAGKSIKNVNIPDQKELKIPRKQVETKEIPLTAFFIDGVSVKEISAIQENFKNLEGQEMAALIYLLEDKGLMSYNNNIKKKSRINFVRAFKQLTAEDLKNISAINKFFEPHTNKTTLIDPNGGKDKTLKIIEEQLNKVVDSC